MNTIIFLIDSKILWAHAQYHSATLYIYRTVFIFFLFYIHAYVYLNLKNWSVEE